ncbi:hypothetical protein L1987_03303 [Smallanthus sonchifolius]|uniref:Uncharacterized protein n=1 Tax=Smallanthus sonchifolius TaxID=185202 RepID=A0ACB9KA52_9ASTR|nr:hypothetical protein L1987_03303 [Smallanthus sonchifolius]
MVDRRHYVLEALHPRGGGFKIMCFLDLETDYINPYELATKINNIALLEFITQGVLCILHLITRHWVMFFLCLPYLYYNVNLYLHRRHLVYATEVFSELSKEKKQRDGLEYRGR